MVRPSALAVLRLRTSISPNAQLFFDVCVTKPLNCGTTFDVLHFGHFASPFALRPGHDQFEGLVALLAHKLIARHITLLVCYATVIRDARFISRDATSARGQDIPRRASDRYGSYVKAEDRCHSST